MATMIARTYTTNQFTWSKATGEFVAEASTLSNEETLGLLEDNSSTVGLIMVSSKTGAKTAWRLVRTINATETERGSWRLLPTYDTLKEFPTLSGCVTIINHDIKDATAKTPARTFTVTPVTPAELGFYLFNDVVYVVVEGKRTGRRYAKEMVIDGNKGKWEYTKGMMYKLTPEHKLTVEQAQALGKFHGVCMICGRTLTDPESVKLGIGPVCIKKIG